MCGLAGFTGIDNPTARYELVWSLGVGIDDRGGDAAGYVTLSPEGRVTVNKRQGHWMTAKDRFLRGATHGIATMMHARFATCGKKLVHEAHPFRIERADRVLYGAHNGVIYDAWESAADNGRNIDVDSEEIFHLLAEDNLEALQKLNGYGVITWVDSRQPTHVKLARLTENSDIHVVSTYGGGIVWGSTESIVKAALKVAGLKQKCSYKLDEIGQVYHMGPGGILKSHEGGVHLSKRDMTFSSYMLRSWKDSLDDNEDDEAETFLVNQWRAAMENDDKDEADYYAKLLTDM